MALIGQLGLGGSERQLFLFLKHVSKARYETHVVSFNPCPNYEYNSVLEDLGVRVLGMPPACVGPVRRLRFLLQLVKSVRPHVVHSWSDYANPYVGLLGLLAGVPVCIGSIRGSLDAEGYQSPAAVFRWLSVNGVHTLVTNSRAAAAEIRGFRWIRGRVVVVPNCVEADGADSVSPADLAPLGIDRTMRVIGSVGNLRPVKNHVLLVEALSRIASRHRDAVVAIVGQDVPDAPGERDRVLAAAREFGVQNRVVLLGCRSDVPALMRRFGVFCLTSLREGMPNVLLEAMAAGCPVVAARVGGIPEVIDDGINGMLVTRGDASGFARALDRVLSDGAYASDLGRSGRNKVIAQFQSETMVRCLTDLYESALSSRLPARSSGRYLTG